MSKHDRDNWLNPANPISPLINPYNPLHPNYQENVDGLARAADEMPSLLKWLIGFVAVISFVAANILLASLTFWTGDGLQLPDFQSESILSIIGLTILYLVGIVGITIRFTIIGSLIVILCYCMIYLFIILVQNLAAFVKWCIACIQIK